MTTVIPLTSDEEGALFLRRPHFQLGGFKGCPYLISFEAITRHHQKSNRIIQQFLEGGLHVAKIHALDTH
jgi:hypothetical protein